MMIPNNIKLIFHSSNIRTQKNFESENEKCIFSKSLLYSCDFVCQQVGNKGERPTD